jgi:hypothetical protein
MQQDSRYFDTEAEASDRLRELAIQLARGRCDMIVIHGPDHLAFYNEGDGVWPTHFRAIREAGADVIHAGVKATPDPDAENVAFARDDAEEGVERGWCEVKFRD